MPTKSGGLGEFGARCVACRSLNEKERNRQQGDRDELSHGFTLSLAKMVMGLRPITILAKDRLWRMSWTRR